MSREEAIEKIKMILAECTEDEDAVCYVTFDDADALDMAIKALEQEPCEEAISKAGVFEILGNLMSIPYDFDRPITEKDVSESMDEIRNLPSVTPATCIAEVTFCKDDLQEIVDEKVEELAQHMERRWIPCSERLPEKCGQYLVTRGHKSCGNLWNRVYIVNYSHLMGLCKEKIWWSGDVGKIDFESYDDVLAWRPLPKPYETESEEK